MSLPGCRPALAILISCGAALAAETSDQALFLRVAPDAMIVLDLSGSMRWNPQGEDDGSQEPLSRFGNDTCSGENFYSTPQPGFTTDCARYLIAKRAIYKILDDNKDGVIDVKDEAGLNVRLGFWKFTRPTGSTGTSGSPTRRSGAVQAAAGVRFGLRGRGHHPVLDRQDQ